MFLRRTKLCCLILISALVRIIFTPSFDCDTVFYAVLVPPVVPRSDMWQDPSLT